MTGAQFYEKLSEAGERMVWNVCPITGFLRGRFRYAKVKRNFCPITAVCYLTNKKYYRVYDAYNAACNINLNMNFASKIMESADYNGSKKIRRHLLRTLNV